MAVRSRLRGQPGDRVDGLRGDKCTPLSWRRGVISEERSVQTGAAPVDVTELGVPLVYGRSDTRVMPAVLSRLEPTVPWLEVLTLRGLHAHRSAGEACGGLVRRAHELAAAPTGATP